MKPLKISMVLLLTFNVNLNAQSNIKSFNFKKGEILDILVLTTKPKTDGLFDRYKKTAFPVAFKMSYKPQPGFGITEITQGNHQPKSFIFGKWESLKKREKFLTQIEIEVPDFHKQRRDIFSFFGLTYYEMKKELSFEINRDKYNVITAYWKKEDSSFLQFKKDWLHQSNTAGGHVVIELNDGKSPFGYYYQPDFLVITEWESKAKFEAFHKENLKMNHKGVHHVNQFVIN